MSSNAKRALLAVSIVLSLALLTYMNYRYAVQAGGGNDFMVRWVGTRYWLTKGISPYDQAVSSAAQEAIYGRPANPQWGEDLAHFAYPLPVAMLLAPLGLLPFPLARAIWMTILLTSLLAIAVMGALIAKWKPGRSVAITLALFAVFWYPGFRAVILGQFAVVNAVFMIAALLAVQRERDRAAGILLGLSTLKPQMSVLLIPFVILWAIWAKRYSVIRWALGSVFVIYGASLILLPRWPSEWLSTLIEYTQYNPVGAPIEVLVDAVPFLPEATSLAVAAALLIYLLREWIVALAKSDSWFQWTAALTIVITHLAAIRTATTNYVNMLPALILVLAAIALNWKHGERWALAALVVLLIPLWVLFVTTLQVGSVEHPVMHLPLPITLLVGLILIRSWQIRRDTVSHR